MKKILILFLSIIALANFSYSQQNKTVSSIISAPMFAAIQNSAGEIVYSNLNNMWNKQTFFSSKNTKNDISFWVSPIYSSIQGGDKRFSMDSVNTALGADIWLEDDSMIALGFDLSFPKYSAFDNEVNADTIHVFTYYGAAVSESVELDFFMDYAFNYYKQYRNFDDEQYKSEFDFSQYGGGFGLSQQIFSNNIFAIKPFVFYEYINLSIPSHSESEGPDALSYKSQSQEIHKLEAGMNLIYCLNSKFNIGAALFYAGILGEASVKTTITNADQSFFEDIIGYETQRDSLGAGLNFNASISIAVLSCRYKYIGANNQENHQIIMNAVFAF
ncbi:MAG: autotransporter outer membrane beta-barrel domain-containing protein [Elusimicrobiota bacterium]|jgi:hypothetical protein|nr:autotransporter outer membrane beta-barrel domain-containing protein [Elusimicrobiota bacterium]